MILFLLAFVAFLIIGIPISVSIGFSAVLGCLSLGYPLVVIGQKMVSGIDSWLLIAIPLFILAGNLMNAGKIILDVTGEERAHMTVADLLDRPRAGGLDPRWSGSRQRAGLGHLCRHVRLCFCRRWRSGRYRDQGHA